MKKILITGMSGLIGGAVRNQLEDKYDLRALNRSNVEGVDCHRADISDFDAIRPAFEGIDTVVHLAAAIKSDFDGFIDHNIRGTYNVFEAANQAGVKRVISASSGSVTAGWENDPPYTALVDGQYDNAPDTWEKFSHKTPTRPRGIYGCTKVWGEAVARHYADSTDMSVICLRIGAVNAEDRPRGTRGYSVWCSQATIAKMVEACINASADLKYDVFYVVSNNKWSYRDTDHAREVLGFEPEGNAEDHR
ncbi:MAG: NAD(P)-dependent oxidoreductase [Candidatus Latescibacteria bacterium]|jgi:nucleoside-diphosphate-sugar epimerase|nr:NAD(P)-dependent oxidoreductase [Candidatus Latescibacterota bacterium]